MRVGLHVGQLFQPVPGGIGRVTELLCAELPRRTDLVAFAATSRRTENEVRVRIGADVDFRKVGPGSPRWCYEMWHRFRRRRLDLDVDVCHAPSLAVPPTTAPLVVTVNDVAFLRHPQTFTRHGVRFHERGLGIARAEAEAIIVPSEFTRDELVREGFDRRRIHCIPLAVRVAPGCRHPEPLTDALHRRGVRAPYLLTVGTIEPRKDHATVLAAFVLLRSAHPDLTLVVAGALGWLPPKDALLLAETSGVVVIGSVADGELDCLYDNADVVVSASIYEGFGLTVLEGMAHARPVVATAIPSHVEIAGDSAGFFVPGDVDALAARAHELLSDPRARVVRGRAGLERARRFDVASTIDAHVVVYERAAFGGG